MTTNKAGGCSLGIGVGYPIPTQPGDAERKRVSGFFFALCVLVCTMDGMNTTDLINRLLEDGWKLARVSGSHHQFKHPTKPGLVTVPHPKKDLQVGTLNAILKQAGLK